MKTVDILDTPIEYLKGVGPARAEVLKKEVAIYNFSDQLVQMNSLVPNVYDLLNGRELAENIWKIEPYCFCWYKINITV